MAGKTFGQRLKHAIKHRGLTNRSLAKKIDVGEGQVSVWVNDHGQPRFEELVRLVEALDVDARYLIVGDRDLESLPPSEIEQRLFQVRRLLREMQQIADVDQPPTEHDRGVTKRILKRAEAKAKDQEDQNRKRQEKRA